MKSCDVWLRSLLQTKMYIDQGMTINWTEFYELNIILHYNKYPIPLGIKIFIAVCQIQMCDNY